MGSQQQKNKEIVLVLGMHRSGTSMMGHVLSSLGYFTGDDEDKVGPANENLLGFAERWDVWKINDQILEENGSSVFEPEKILENNPEVLSEQKKKYKPQIEQILEDLFKDNDKVFIKDPRICLTFPFWEEALNEYDLKVIYIYRDPLEVSSSLMNRSNIESEDRGVELWSIYNESAIRSVKDHSEIIFVKYNSFLTDPIAESWGLKKLLEVGQDDLIKAVLINIEPSLRNNINKERSERSFKKNIVAKTVWDDLEKRNWEYRENNKIEEEILDSIELTVTLLKQKSEQFKQILVSSKTEAENFRKDIIDKDNYILHLTEIIEEKDKEKKLTQDHIKNLEHDISNKQEEINRLNDLINSPTYLFKRVIKVPFNRIAGFLNKN